jgi:DNA-binding transcriptional regulator YiaG
MISEQIHFVCERIKVHKRLISNSSTERKMPNIATVLKGEISRIARKEIRSDTAVVKKASAQYRKEIAALKRQVSNMQSRVSVLEKQVLRDVQPQVAETNAKDVRFTAKGLRSQRKRLGLSAEDFGKLVGVSSLTIYSWEKGTSRPRKSLLPMLASIRKIGKREVKARLEQLSKGSQKKS